MEWCKQWVLIYEDNSQEIVYADNFFELSQKVEGKNFVRIKPLYNK